MRARAAERLGGEERRIEAEAGWNLLITEKV